MEKEKPYISPKADELGIRLQGLLSYSPNGDTQKMDWSEDVEDGDKWE